MSGKYQVRSISLPSRFHPANVRIEQEINSLKSYGVSSSNELCSVLSGLEEAYNSADELVHLQSASTALFSFKSEQCVSDWFDGSDKMLDVCSTSREALLTVKGHVQDIQSALRIRKSDSSIHRSISAYLSFRKKMTKNISKMISVLKQVNQLSTANKLNDESSRMIKVLKDVTAVTISIFESLLTFLAAPSSGSKMSKWSLVSGILMSKRVAAAHHDGVLNEFGCVDAVISKSSCSQVLASVSMEALLERLAALEKAVGCIEAQMECIFRCLVKLRVSILNNMSN